MANKALDGVTRFFSTSWSGLKTLGTLAWSPRLARNALKDKPVVTFFAVAARWQQYADAAGELKALKAGNKAMSGKDFPAGAPLKLSDPTRLTDRSALLGLFDDVQNLADEAAAYRMVTDSHASAKGAQALALIFGRALSKWKTAIDPNIKDAYNLATTHVALATVAAINGAEATLADPATMPALCKEIFDLAKADSAAGHATRIALGAAILYGIPGKEAAVAILDHLKNDTSGYAAVRGHATTILTQLETQARAARPAPKPPLPLVPGTPRYNEKIDELDTAIRGNVDELDQASFHALCQFASKEIPPNVARATLIKLLTQNETAQNDSYRIAKALVTYAVADGTPVAVGTMALEELHAWRANLRDFRAIHEALATAVQTHPVLQGCVELVGVPSLAVIDAAHQRLGQALIILAKHADPTIQSTLSEELLAQIVLDSPAGLKINAHIFWPEGNPSAGVAAQLRTLLEAFTGIRKNLVIALEHATTLDDPLVSAPIFQAGFAICQGQAAKEQLIAKAVLEQAIPYLGNDVPGKSTVALRSLHLAADIAHQGVLPQLGLIALGKSSALETVHKFTAAKVADLSTETRCGAMQVLADLVESTNIGEPVRIEAFRTLDAIATDLRATFTATLGAKRPALAILSKRADELAERIMASDALVTIVQAAKQPATTATP